MTRLERLSEVQRIDDLRLRYWIVARWREALMVGGELCFIVLAPSDPPVPTLWSVCVGESDAQPGLDDVAGLVEYVVDHERFYELLILPTQDSGIVVVVPKSDELEASWSHYLQQVAVPAEPTSQESVGVSLSGFRPSFDLGRVVATPGALSTLERYRVSALQLLERHVQGDWGGVCAEDAAENQRALREGGRLLSSYAVAESVKVWIITEADRSVTTLLLPEDY